MSFEFGSDIRERTHRLNRRRLTDARAERSDYVLVWIQQALRAHDNPALDAGIELANAHDLPVVVYHGLRMDYPHASDRLHRFILGASRDLERDCEARGLRCVTYVETEDHREKGLVYRLAERALAVVTDEQFVFVARWQAQSFAARAEVPVISVDAARLVPTRILAAGLSTTPAFRRASGEHRPRFLDYGRDFEPHASRFTGDLGFQEAHNAKASDDDLDRLVASCRIDHTLPPCPDFPASRKHATDRTYEFVKTLANYPYKRNNPADENAVSRLSPYLHFGVLGPRELARAVRDSDHKSNPKWKFGDELLTWREWFHYLAFHNAESDVPPESFETVPERPRRSLEAHAEDPREEIYTLDDLLHGNTDDETWNAAQRQWLSTGYMHNNLRMYWGKKIIGWTRTPRAAWITACYINDRLSLDGRDPATYGNMQWCFGRAKPAYREQPVYGWVAPKTDRAVRKRPGAEEWLARLASAEALTVSVPNTAFVATDFENVLVG